MANGDGDGSRALRVAAIAAACFVLTGVLVLRGFPYELLAQRVARQVESATGTRVEFRELDPCLTRGGPGFEAAGVRIDTAGGTHMDLDRVLLRPAWSLAWLRLTPALYTEVDTPLGRVAGVLVVRRPPGFTGRIEAVDLARLPVKGALPGLELSGILDADVDLASSETGPEGSLVLHAEKGSVRTGDLPMALPFETADGELVFGGENILEVRSFETQSPLFSAEVKGTLGQARPASTAPLDLRVSYKVEPQMRSTLEGIGLRTQRDGSGSLRITGTPAAPEVR